MSGKNQIAQFKETFGADSTFVGGNLDPATVGIVGLSPEHPQYLAGVDVPLEDWNADLWDAARLTMAATDPIDPVKLIKTVDMGGSIDPIKVVKRRNIVLASNGRRRILAARAANRILVQRGESVDALIELGAVVDKSRDVEVSVRVANAGRLDDPPWISAANAARMLGRGKDEDQIAAILEKEPNTIANWLAYAAILDPKIKTQIEDPAIPKADRLPFAIGVELAKGTDPGNGQAAGVDEYRAQNQALDYLRTSGAKLTGEKGRENAKAVIRAVKAGTLGSEAPAVDNGPPSSPGGDMTPPAPQAASSAPSTGPNPPAAPKDQTPPTNAGKAPSTRGNVQIVTQAPKLSWPAIRELGAQLEPSPSAPHTTDAERVTHAVFMVLTGQDPTADGLNPWPTIQAKFRKVVRSPDAPIAPADKTPAPSAQKTAPAAKDPPVDVKAMSTRSIKCPNVTCDKGHDTRKRSTCAICDGYGKISPARQAQIKVTKKAS